MLCTTLKSDENVEEKVDVGKRLERERFSRGSTRFEGLHLIVKNASAEIFASGGKS